ncbi:MAG: hypothetical protein LBL56_05175 [Treponema sp.]|jgi:hypothetical protein|nr:hypothetical protein [Treponema sp.]
MLKIVYDPEDGGDVKTELCLVAQGIQVIFMAMHAYAVDENGEGREFGDAATSVWPVLKILMEPIADYFFDPDAFAPPEKADEKENV